MKKPDCFIAFDWPKFQASTPGMRRELKWSYWTACCAYYWGDCHGLENDDDTLRGICECYDPEDWERTKAGIFGKFFKLEHDGRWHQKRTREEYERAQEQIVKLEERAKAGAAARWNGKEHAKAMPKHMLKQCPTPTPTPLPSDTPPPPPNNCTQTQKGLRQYPSLEEAKTNGQFIGMGPKDCEDFWNHFESSGWVDKNGNPVVNWRAKQATWKTSNQASKLEAAHHAAETAQGDGLDQTSRILLGKEYERAVVQIKRIEDNAAMTAMGDRIYTPQEAAQLKKLKARRSEIKQKLGIIV